MVAPASGTAPHWAQSFAAAEAGLLARAAAASLLGSVVRTDGKGVSQVCARGRRFATDAGQVCAAVWRHFRRGRPC